MQKEAGFKRYLLPNNIPNPAIRIWVTIKKAIKVNFEWDLLILSFLDDFGFCGKRGSASSSSDSDVCGSFSLYLKLNILMVCIKIAQANTSSESQYSSSAFGVVLHRVGFVMWDGQETLCCVKKNHCRRNFLTMWTAHKNCEISAKSLQLTRSRIYQRDPWMLKQCWPYRNGGISSASWH